MNKTCINIGLDNDLAPFRWQAIIQINGNQFQVYAYVPLSLSLSLNIWMIKLSCLLLGK